MTNLQFLVNKTGNDVNFATQPTYYELVDTGDILIFSAGSSDVADGQPIPTDVQLNRAATVSSLIADVIVAHYFLADNSANLLKEVSLAGKNVNQFVFCVSFDGPTASEPVLEAWNDVNMNSNDLTCLGSGIPNNSWYHAIATLSGPPGAGWTGIPLAGSGTSNHVLLNGGNGAIADPGTGNTAEVYFNFYVNIPAGTSTPGVNNPILAIIYTSN